MHTLRIRHTPIAFERIYLVGGMVNFKKRISSLDPSRSTSTFCMQTVLQSLHVDTTNKISKISNFEVKFRLESVTLF